MKDRIDIINNLIKRHNYNSYLEIGVNKGYTFGAINIKDKDGVDPAGNCNYVMTSDDFFSQRHCTNTYDIIFIDGLHTCDQVLRDVFHSTSHLSSNGTIVLHDCNPSEELHQTEKESVAIWNGTVWKAVANLKTFPGYSIYVIDIDYGIGIIKRGKQNPIQLPDILDWNYLVNNRKQILNLITMEEYDRLSI